MAAANFYSQLTGFRDYAELAQGEHFVRAPEDWSVVVTDIEGSTKAIEEGRYKVVNVVGAATIAAIVNTVGEWDVPFVFGGDGATALVPDSKLDVVKVALCRSRAISESSHGLKVRIGIVPHRELIAAGCPVFVAKYALNEKNALAFFRGQALSQAEKWVKAGRFLLENQNAPEELDPHAGLSCRWAPLGSQRGSFLSILIKLHDETHARQLLADLDQILDFDSPAAHPVKTSLLKPERTWRAAFVESSMRVQGLSWIRFLRNVGFMWFMKLLDHGWIGPNVFDMQKYRNSLAPHSDFRKFDEMIRMVVDVTPEMRRQVETLLAGYRKRGLLAYGLHESATALLTCFVADYHDHHMHFVDGSDGGYAYAAKQLKAQLADGKTASSTDLGSLA